MNAKLLLHFLKILLRDRKKIFPMILILIITSASIYASEYSIYNLRNVIFLESLNLIPDVRIRSSNENFTLSIVNMISSIITEEYLEYRPNVKIDTAFRLKEGFAIVSPREAFNYIVGINMSSDWVVEFLKNNIIACLSNFTFDNHYNNFTMIIPKYLADFLNLTIGDKIISYEGYTFTVAAIYNVTTLFSDILANVLFELPIFTSINTFNIMLNYTTSKIIERIIAIRYRDPLIKDVNQYEEELMSFLTFLQDRLAEKKIALSIEKDGATAYPYVPDAKLILISSMPKIKLINSVNEDIIKNVRLIIDAISYFSVTIAFCITFVAFLSSLNERRREIAIIRALGLSPFSISLALVLTTTFILTISFIIGVMLSPIISQVITKILKEITGNKLLGTFSEMPWNLEMLLSSYAILLISSQIATLTPFIFTIRESIATGLYQFKASKIKRISISRWYHVISLLVFILCITLSAYAILFEPLNIDILQIDVILWFTWPILFGITLFSKIPSYINKVVTKFSRSAYISTKHLKAYYARTLILFILLVFVFHYTLIPMAFSNFWVIGYRKELHELNEGKIPIVVSETTTVSSLDLVDEFAEIPGVEYVVGFREFYVKNCKCNDTIITSTDDVEVSEMYIKTNIELNNTDLATWFRIAQVNMSFEKVISMFNRSSKGIAMAIISSKLASKVNAKVGSLISLEITTGGPKKFTIYDNFIVVAIAENYVPFLERVFTNDYFIILPKDYIIKHLANVTLDITFVSHTFYIKASKGNLISVVRYIKENYKYLSISVGDIDEVLKRIKSEKEYQIFLKEILLVPYMLIASVFVFIFYFSIDEKKREIAILKTLGASLKDILLSLLYENLFVFLLAMIVGTMGSFGLILFMFIIYIENNYGRMPSALDFYLFLNEIPLDYIFLVISLFGLIVLITVVTSVKKLYRTSIAEVFRAL